MTVRPTDTGAALLNPGMGWTMHFYSNVPANYGSKLEPSDALDWFPGCSTVYLRVPWSFVEPEEGRYNWAMLDTPAQRWIDRGGRVAFRITCSENWTKFATPEWVKTAGAKGTFYRFPDGPVPGDSGPTWDPVFDDPVFLDKFDRFLAAMAKRYDGQPAVAFIDIGSFGLWGEGHTMMSSRVPDDRSRDIARRHIDLHLKHFKRTQLCISDDVDGHDNRGPDWPVMAYARSKGVTMRDDSIMVQPPPRSWYHAEMAAAFWPEMPVILEHEHFGSSKARNAWGDGTRLLQAVEDYHASYLSIHWWPREFYDANSNLVDRINRRLGYRIRPRELSWPARVAVRQPFAVDWSWENAGVAPCYGGGFPALTIKDAKGGIVSVLVDESFDVAALQPGPEGRPPAVANRPVFTIGLHGPATSPGPCGVFVSVGDRDGTPRLALPLPGDDGRRRYRVGASELVRVGL